MARRFSEGSYLETALAAASTVDIGAVHTLKVNITAGAGSVNSFGTVHNRFKLCRASTSFTLVYGASMILPGGVNLPVTPDATWIAESNSVGVWRVRGYQLASGKAIVAPAIADISDISALGTSLMTAASAGSARSLLGLIFGTDLYSKSGADAAIASAVAALVNASPAALDTLKELADALGDDANFAATMTTALAGKQTIDGMLTALAAITSANNKGLYFTGADAPALYDLSSFGRTIGGLADAAALFSQLSVSANGKSLVQAADYAAMRTLLGLVLGTDIYSKSGADAAIATAVAALVNSSPAALDTLKELADALGDDANFAATMTTALGGKQALHAMLTALAGLTSANDKGLYFTGVNAPALYDLTSFGRTLGGSADAKAARSTLKVEGRTAQGDADHTFVATDGPFCALTAALTAARTWTLPAANALNAGTPRWIVDEIGGFSVTNRLTIAGAGSDTVEGGTSLKLATPYGAVCLVSDGVSKWTKVGIASFDQASHRLGDETSIASASTIDIGTSPTTRILVTGSTSPTSFGSVPNKLRLLRFPAGLVLPHNGSTSFLNAGGASYTTKADDEALALLDSSGVCRQFLFPANGKSVVAPTYADVGVRERLTAARTYYVRTDGSNSNNGLADSAGGAFLTIQAAVNAVAAIDCGGFTVTIQVRNGSFNNGVALKDTIGGIPIILGDETTPSNVSISTAGTCISTDGLNTKWEIRGIKIASSGGNGIAVNNGSRLGYRNVDFGAVAVAQVYVGQGSLVVAEGAAYAISGSASYHWLIDGGRIYVVSGFVCTLSGTPAFTAFVNIQHCASLIINSGSFSGSATGVRYDIRMNAVVDANGAGATFLPGNSAGSTSTGGQYG